MTAKKAPSPESQKIWGFFTNECEVCDGLTYQQAVDRAIEHKKDEPYEEVTIFRVVAVVENQPALKMV